MLSAKIPNDVRKAVYRRDYFACAICDSRRSIQIHHVIHRSHGGSNSPQNLITLCMYCHNTIHGTRFPDMPDWMTAPELEQACVEYLADYYAPDWDPWEH